MNKFWAMFATKFRLKTINKKGSVMHSKVWISILPKFRKKTNYPTPRKCPDRWKNRRIERPYFTGFF